MFLNVSETENILEKIIEKYKDKPWSFQLLSRNKNISPKFFLKNSNCNWDYLELSKILDPNFILENPQYPWCYFNLSQNKNINHALIESNPKILWNYYFLSKILNPEYILKNWNDNYSILLLSSNKKITQEHILNNRYLEWDWYNLGKNPSITPEFYYSNFFTLKTEKLFIRGYVKNPKLSIEYIQNNIDKFYFLSDIISLNKNINYKIVINTQVINWNWINLSKNPYVCNPFIVKKYPNSPWNINSFFENPSFKYDDLKPYLDKYYLIDNYIFSKLSTNNSLTYNDIVKNISNIDIYSLSLNNLNKNSYLKRKLKTKILYRKLLYMFLSRNLNYSSDIFYIVVLFL